MVVLPGEHDRDHDGADGDRGSDDDRAADNNGDPRGTGYTTDARAATSARRTHENQQNR